MQTPLEIARSLYQSGGPDTWKNDFAAHRHCGHILSTDEFFFMWRVVPMDWDVARMLDPWQSDESGNVAFLWIICGQWQKAVMAGLEITPWVRWAAYERRGKLRLMEISKVLTISK